MQFKPFVCDKSHTHITVSIKPMTLLDAEATNDQPLWKTSWTSEYLSDPRFEKYAAKVDDELIALAAYEILKKFSGSSYRLCRSSSRFKSYP